MIRMLSAALAVLVCASVATAQPFGTVGLFTDAAGNEGTCFAEEPGQVNRIYVVHTTHPEASGSRFRLDFSWDPGSLFADLGDNVADGSILDGATVTYGGCRPLPFLIAVVEWVPTVLAPTCATIDVAPDPAAPSGTVTHTDCSGESHPSIGGSLIVNAVICDPFEGWTCGPVSSQITTWGLIKSLYTN